MAETKVKQVSYIEVTHEAAQDIRFRIVRAGDGHQALMERLHGHSMTWNMAGWRDFPTELEATTWATQEMDRIVNGEYDTVMPQGWRG